MDYAAVFGAVNVFLLDAFAGVGTVASLPLVPAQAMKRGTENVPIGFVIALLTAFMTLGSLLCPPLLSRYGLRLCVVGASTAAAGFSTLFCFLEFIPYGWTFTGLTYFFCLILGGCFGTALPIYATVLLRMAPEKPASIFGLMAAIPALILCAGLAPSAVVATTKSHFVLFLVYSIATLCLCCTAMYVLPEEVDQRAEDPRFRAIAKAFFEAVQRLMLRHRAFAAGLIANLVFFVAYGFVGSIMDSFIHKAFPKLTKIEVGLMFGVQVVGIIAAPAFGYFCDRKGIYKPFQILGFFMVGIPMFLMDPLPEYGWGKPHLWMAMPSLALQGVGVGMFIPSISGDLIGAVKAIPQREEVFGRTVVCAAIFSQSLGVCFGSLLGGALHRFVTLPRSTVGVASFEILAGFIWLIYCLIHKPERQEVASEEVETPTEE